MQFDGFDWDDGNWPKCGKHGVSFEEIEACLVADTTLFFKDAKHSTSEPRFAAVGRSILSGRTMIVHFTLRRKAGQMARPVSARFMHAEEIGRYERTKR